MQVKVTRRGGLAGIPLHGAVDTATLRPGERRAAETALATLPNAAPKRVGTGYPDGFQYDLAFDGRAVTLDENGIPAGLRPVSEAAMEHAALG